MARQVVVSTTIPPWPKLSLAYDKPYVGLMFDRAAPLTNTYTWANRPSATGNNAYGMIYISDWKTRFVSNGTRWVPLQKHLILSCGAGSTLAAASGAHENLLSVAVPANLMAVGCLVEIKQMWFMTGGTLKTLRVCLASGFSNPIMSTATAAAALTARVTPSFIVAALTGAGSVQSMESTVANNFEFTGNTSALAPLTIDWTADQVIVHGFSCTDVAVTRQLAHQAIEITFP